MPSRKRWVRVVRAFALAVFAALAVLFAFVQIQQLVSWRAERLLADMKQIQMGKSTWADAQRLMTRWGKWNASWDGLECSSQFCSYVISIDDESHALHRFPLIDGGQWESKLRWPRWVNWPYSWAGGRFAVVRAEFEVRNGVIWSKSFAVLLAPFLVTYSEDSGLNALSKSSVMGQATCRAQCFHWRWLSRGSVFSVDNPESSLFVTDGDDGHSAAVQFTPFADEKTVDALLEFNLNCLRRWKDCRAVSELMPAAAALYKAGVNDAKIAADPNYLPGLPLWIAARDADYVAIAEPLGPQTHTPLGQQGSRMSFRIKRLLKGDSEMPGRDPYMVKVVGSEEYCPVPGVDPRGLSPGAEVLLIFSGQINEAATPEAELSPCVAVLRTNPSLAEVQHGIDRASVLNNSATSRP